MDIAQLKTLVHVAELGSLTKAAERLNIAQPALSRQIKLLEAELGVSLFDRHGRGMVISDAGRDVLDHAIRIMTEMESIRNTTANRGSPYHGTVMIGTTPTVAKIATIPLVESIRHAHPQLKVRFTSAFSGHLLDWLQRGDLDLAVFYDPKPLKSLRIVPILLENLLVVSVGGGKFRLDHPQPFTSLADEELVLPSPRHGLRRIMEDCAHRAGVTLRASVEADSLEAMIDLVRHGFGSTVLPLAPIHALVETGELCAAPLVDPTPVRKVVLAYPADRPVSRAARFVGDRFAQIAADLVEQKIWIGRMLDPDDPPRPA